MQSFYITTMLENNMSLHRLLVQIAEENSYDGDNITINPVENDGANYTSKIFMAVIKSNGKQDLNLFAKVATVGEKMREASPIQIFQTESYFYKKILPLYRELEEQYNIADENKLLTPKFYGSNDTFLNEILVLENLVAKDFQGVDRFKPMRPDFAFKGVQQLAHLHALSMALQIHKPKEYEKTLKVVQIEMSSKPLMDFLKNMISSVIEATNDHNKTLIKKYIESALDIQTLESLIKSNKTTVIVHADYRGSNLMFKRSPDGLKIAILDFQTIHLGRPVSDLLYFIINGADKNFLENHYDAVLNHYYTSLCATLNKFNINSQKKYSKEEFNEDLKQYIHMNLVLGFCTLLVVTVEADKAPKVDKDLGLADFAVSPSEIYKERLNGVIDYFIKKGVITL